MTSHLCTWHAKELNTATREQTSLLQAAPQRDQVTEAEAPPEQKLVPDWLRQPLVSVAVSVVLGGLSLAYFIGNLNDRLDRLDDKLEANRLRLDGRIQMTQTELRDGLSALDKEFDELARETARMEGEFRGVREGLGLRSSR